MDCYFLLQVSRIFFYIKFFFIYIYFAVPGLSEHVASLVAKCELSVEVCGFKFHDQASNPGPLDLERGVPATGPPGWWSLKWWKIF